MTAVLFVCLTTLLCIPTVFAGVNYVSLEAAPPEEQVVAGITDPNRLRIVGSGPNWQMLPGNIHGLVTNITDGFNVVFENNLPNGEPSMMHQHGLIPPVTEDGVPFISALPMTSGSIRRSFYSIQPNNTGTFFSHSHFRDQHGRGLAFPIIVANRPEKTYPFYNQIKYAMDVVMMIDDYCPFATTDGRDSNPTCDAMVVYEALLNAFDSNAPVNMEICPEAANTSDVSFHVMTANGRPPNDPMFQAVPPGGWVRLRIINSASMSHSLVRFPAPVTLVAVDGDWIQPITGLRSWWVATAQRIDVIFQLNDTAAVSSSSSSDGGSSEEKDIISMCITQKTCHDGRRYDTVLGKKLAEHHAADFGAMAFGSGYDPEQGFPIIATLESSAEPLTAAQAVLVLYDSGVGAPQRKSWPLTSQLSPGWMTSKEEALLVAWTPLPQRAPDQIFTLHLSGDNGFKGINGLSFQINGDKYVTNPQPLQVKLGQRIHIRFINNNADNHAMHLHGHDFQVIEVDGQPINGAVRDTVLVTGGGCHTVVIAFDANNAGIWPLHCHMDLHMMAGMVTTVEYVQ